MLPLIYFRYIVISRVYKSLRNDSCPLHADSVISPVNSTEVCREACDLGTKFKCRSFTFLPGDSKCCISGAVMETTSPTAMSGAKYYELVHK